MASGFFIIKQTPPKSLSLRDLRDAIVEAVSEHSEEISFDSDQIEIFEDQVEQMGGETVPLISTDNQSILQWLNDEPEMTVELGGETVTLKIIRMKESQNEFVGSSDDESPDHDSTEDDRSNFSGTSIDEVLRLNKELLQAVKKSKQSGELTQGLSELQRNLEALHRSDQGRASSSETVTIDCPADSLALLQISLLLEQVREQYSAVDVRLDPNSSCIRVVGPRQMVSAAADRVRAIVSDISSSELSLSPLQKEIFGRKGVRTVLCREYARCNIRATLLWRPNAENNLLLVAATEEERKKGVTTMQEMYAELRVDVRTTAKAGLSELLLTLKNHPLVYAVEEEGAIMLAGTKTAVDFAKDKIDQWHQDHQQSGAVVKPAASHDENDTVARTLEVRWDADASLDVEVLLMYLEIERRSGGGTIERHQTVGKNCVQVTFESADALKRVLNRESHTADGIRIAVQPAPLPPPLDNQRLLLRGIHKDKMEDEGFKLFVERFAGEEPRTVQASSAEASLLMLSFDHDLDFARVLEKHAQRPTFGGTTTGLERVRVPRTIAVISKRPLTTELLELYFESQKRSGGGDIEAVNLSKDGKRAWITYVDHNVVASVLPRGHSLAGAKLRVVPCYPELNPIPVEEEPAAAPTATATSLFEGSSDAAPAAAAKAMLPKRVKAKGKSVEVQVVKTVDPRTSAFINRRPHIKQWFFEAGKACEAFVCITTTGHIVAKPGKDAPVRDDPVLLARWKKTISQALQESIAKLTLKKIALHVEPKDVASEVQRQGFDQSRNFQIRFEASVAFIIGEKTSVDEAARKLEAIMQQLQGSAQSDVVQREVVFDAHYKLQLLSHAGHIATLRAKYPDVLVKFDKPRRAIALSGPAGDVQAFEKSLHEKLKSARSESVELTGQQKKLFTKKTFREELCQLFSSKKVMAVFFCEPHAGLSLWAFNDAELKKAYQLVKEAFQREAGPAASASPLGEDPIMVAVDPYILRFIQQRPSWKQMFDTVCKKRNAVFSIVGTNMVAYKNPGTTVAANELPKWRQSVQDVIESKLKELESFEVTTLYAQPVFNALTDQHGIHTNDVSYAVDYSLTGRIRITGDKKVTRTVLDRLRSINLVTL